MYPSEATELHYLLSPNPTHQFQSHFSLTTATPPVGSYPNYINPLYHQLMLTPQPACTFSSNSTSDEADDHEQQLSIINERKQRRMISNRESARRSRMRKQKHLDELWSQVVWYRNENQQLMNKLNLVSERHDIMAQENAQLKEEVSELRQIVTGMRINSPFPSLDDDPCNDLQG